MSPDFLRNHLQRPSHFLQMLCAFLKSLPVIYLHFKTPSPAKLGIKEIQKSIWNCRLHERIRIIYVLLFHRMVCDSVQAYFRCMHKSTHSLLHIIYGPPWCQTHFGDKAVGLNGTFSKGMREWTRTPPQIHCPQQAQLMWLWISILQQIHVLRDFSTLKSKWVGLVLF